MTRVYSQVGLVIISDNLLDQKNNLELGNEEQLNATCANMKASK